MQKNLMALLLVLSTSLCASDRSRYVFPDSDDEEEMSLVRSNAKFDANAKQVAAAMLTYSPTRTHTPKSPVDNDDFSLVTFVAGKKQSKKQ